MMNSIKEWNNGDLIYVKGFAKQVCTLDKFKANILETRFVENINDGTTGDIDIMALHSKSPIFEFVESKRRYLERLTASICNVPSTIMTYSLNRMTPGQGISLHNDWYEENDLDVIIARAIIYINPTYVFGTRLHYSPDPRDERHMMAGGNPGDLFIFKCSPDSWHSVGKLTEQHTDRYTINMSFVASA